MRGGGNVFRNNYKGHMDKRVEVGEGGEDGWSWGRVVGGKGRQLSLNNNKIILKISHSRKP